PDNRHANSDGLAFHYAPAETLVQVKYMTPQSSLYEPLEPSGEARRHHRGGHRTHRGGHRTHRRSHHRTPKTRPQRSHPAHANLYASPNPAPHPAQVPMPANAPPMIPAQAYTSHAIAPHQQQPVRVHPAPAPQNYSTNAGPVNPPVPVPASAPAPPEPYATNSRDDYPLPCDPEPYTRYYHPSGAPVPRSLSAHATVAPAPPTQKVDSRPSQSCRLSNAYKSLFQKSDRSRAPASATLSHVVHAPVPPRPLAQPAAPQVATPRAHTNRHVASGRRPKETTGRSSPVFNIYTRDTLPQIYGTGRDCHHDPHWQGADKEKINVLMPVGLLDCWSILFNARNLKEIHFWHITGDDSWRKFPAIDVHRLQTIKVHFNEAWLTNLLKSLHLRDFHHFEACYSRGCAERFAYDKPAYRTFVKRACKTAKTGYIHISPNHPVYGDRVSSLQRTLKKVCQKQQADWDVLITDIRA
ncbi:hypothetical protein K523DRAFT_255174, partial [Schizophyllum commune Tattone D]